MGDSDEILNFQVALAKKVINKTGDSSMPIEFQLSIYDQINRDIRMTKINKNGKINNGSNKATSKQKKLMDDLGIDYKEDIDVKTASKLIGEALNKE